MNHPLQTTPIVEWNAGNECRRLDEVVAEEPLEIRVDGAPVSVTMRTPGDDVELAAGFLFTEGIIDAGSDLVRLGYAHGRKRGRQCNTVDVTLRSGKTFDVERLRRHFFASSSCGMCGKASIDAVRVRGIRPPKGDFRLDPELLTSLPTALRPAQALFERTGGLHAAALFDSKGTLLGVREDVGRHNAVDKIVGHAVLAGTVPLSEHILFVSGRGGFEIVQKALVAGVPVVGSVSAPSSLAVGLAREYGLTLIGFLRGHRFVVYAGEGRIVRDARPENRSCELAQHRT
jgi:FdhD protein